MAHAAPPPPGHRRRNSVIGAVVVVVGVVLAVIAVIGLNHPKGTDAGATTSQTRTVTTSATPSSSPSSSPSSRPSTSTPPTTPKTTPATTRSSSSTPSSSASTIPLVVANNTSRTDLAATARARFEAKGWKVSSTLNYQNTLIISTCAYWDPTVPGAEAAAEKLQQQFPNILRVKQRFDQLPSGPVVVVLNDDYS